ncbi:MAG: hypothetical protein Ct9H90mP30_0950 [Actinomycetota bacterium]|nr:MAG: hypothetical protein Ct9H90mP30_0950 [Actinomycetota bacterium]
MRRMAPSLLFPKQTRDIPITSLKVKENFEIAVNVNVNICDNISEGLFMQKAILAFYIGGMGAQKRNFHTELMARMGYESEANNIQSLFLSGKRDEAIHAVPDAFADEISLVGPLERIKERLELWEKISSNNSYHWRQRCKNYACNGRVSSVESDSLT